MEQLEQENMLSVQEVAKRFNVSKQSIYRLIEDRQLPADRIGNILRIKKSDVEQFLMDNKTVFGLFTGGVLLSTLRHNRQQED